MDKVYIFYYNSCIHESSAEAVSLHKTLKGAYDAMRKDKMEAYNIWFEDRLIFGKTPYEKHARHEYWFVGSKAILE